MNNYNNEWLELNDYEKNADYIEKLLKRFNISRYNPINNGKGYCDLTIEHNLYKYKVELDCENCVANIRRGKRVYISNKSSREYMPIKHTVKQDLVWYDVIKYISKDFIKTS